MRRSIFGLGLLVGMSWAGSAAAHGVTVDGSKAEWPLLPPPVSNVNTGHIARNVANEGVFIWRDATGDERTDFASPDPRVDIVEARITGDATNLYVLVEMANIDLASGNGAPQIQIAISTGPGGQADFAGFADTTTSVAGEWEFLIQTRLGSGNTDANVWDPMFNNVATGSVAASTANDVIEIAVPWSAIGGAPTGPLRFTVLSFRGDTNDGTSDIGGNSDALDAITNYGDPGLTSNTFAEVTDGTADYSFELYFHLDPDFEPSAPVVVNEALYDTPAGCLEGAAEWVELYNRSGAAIDIAGWTFADEETVDGAEGAGSFPAGASIAMDAVTLFAGSATAYGACFMGAPAPDFDGDVNSATTTLLAQPLWASGNVTGTNVGDELLLLDPSFTVVDVLVYGNGTYANVVAGPNVGQGHSLERLQPTSDTDDVTVDFVDNGPAAITPGAIQMAGMGGMMGQGGMGGMMGQGGMGGMLAQGGMGGMGGMMGTGGMGGTMGQGGMMSTTASTSASSSSSSATTGTATTGTGATASVSSTAAGPSTVGAGGSSGDDTVDDGGCAMRPASDDDGSSLPGLGLLIGLGCLARRRRR